MSAVTDFKAIRVKLDRMEQKAEFEEKNPKPAMYGGLYGILVATKQLSPSELNDQARRLMGRW